jgi:hypothetical protein
MTHDDALDRRGIRNERDVRNARIARSTVSEREPGTLREVVDAHARTRPEATFLIAPATEREIAGQTLLPDAALIAF